MKKLMRLCIAMPMTISPLFSHEGHGSFGHIHLTETISLSLAGVILCFAAGMLLYNRHIFNSFNKGETSMKPCKNQKKYSYQRSACSFDIPCKIDDSFTATIAFFQFDSHDGSDRRNRDGEKIID